MLQRYVGHKFRKIEIHSTSDLDHGTVIDYVYVLHPVMLLFLEAERRTHHLQGEP